MKLGDHSKEAQERLNTLIAEMSHGPDRTVAIVGGAWVEEMLGSAIESFLQPHKEAWKNLFGRSRPMSSFSAKIDLARLLGMVTDEIWADLHSIRQVRNDFAHGIAHKDQHTALSFAYGQIMDRCLSLRCVKAEAITDPREAFMRACARLSADLDMVRFLGTPVTGSGVVCVGGANVA